MLNRRPRFRKGRFVKSTIDPDALRAATTWTNGPALVDRQIAQLIEKENGTSVASVTRESGGFMIAQLIEKEKLGTSMIRRLSPAGC